MSIKNTLISLLLCFSCVAQADNLDNFIKEEMQKRQIPGLSLVVVDGGKIVKTQGYGVTEKGGTVAVVPTTLFQAGSVSKPVAALGTMVLVEQGKLDLDEEVNQKLRSWKIPENSFTETKKVTLRRIMSHSAGLSVHGFRGYSHGENVPSLLQVLNGEKPANSSPVKVIFEPGAKYQYSGGGTTVMQQLVIDVTGKPFDEFMQESVLTPLAMRSSSFAQPLAPSMINSSASAHSNRRQKIAGGHHIYPEMAAAGLWTTPSDLAKFATAIQDAYAGKANSIISKKLAEEMLHRQTSNTGLGFFIKDDGKTQEFSHGGRDEGFDTRFSATFATGKAAILMINTNDNSGALDRIMREIADEYKWATKVVPDEKKAIANANAAPLDVYTGYYDDGNGYLLELVTHQGNLATVSDGFVDSVLFPSGDHVFSTLKEGISGQFSLDSRGEVTAVQTTMRNTKGNLNKISALLTSLQAQQDTDQTRTRNVTEVLSELAKVGAKDSASVWIADNTKKVFVRPMPELMDFKALQFLKESSLESLNISRHKGKAKTLLAYKLNDEVSLPFVLVYLNDAGQLIDFDVVKN